MRNAGSGACVGNRSLDADSSTRKCRDQGNEGTREQEDPAATVNGVSLGILREGDAAAACFWTPMRLYSFLGPSVPWSLGPCPSRNALTAGNIFADSHPVERCPQSDSRTSVWACTSGAKSSAGCGFTM